MYMEISYCCPAPIGNGYASGSRRFASAKAFLEWLEGQLKDGKPVLVTTIRYL